jgi:hypothetical protein
MRQYKAEIVVSDRYNDDKPLTHDRIQELIVNEDLHKEGLEVTKVTFFAEIIKAK